MTRVWLSRSSNRERGHSWIPLLWLAVGAVCLLHYGFLAAWGDPLNLGSLCSLLAAGAGMAAFALGRRGHGPASLPRSVRLVLLALLILFAAYYVGTVCWMAVAARSDESQPVDVVLVLGAGVRDGQPSVTLRQRIDRAAAYLADHPAVPAILCGGVGRGERFSEAEVMRRELSNRGVSVDRLHIEPQSTSTSENLRFAMPLVRAHTGKAEARVLVVTSNFHLARAKLLARNLGLVAYGLPATTPWYLLPNATLRESAAIAKSVLVDLR